MLVVLVLGILLVLAARYGADSRSTGADPRDPARPRVPRYAHTPACDVRLLVGHLASAVGRR